MGLLDQQMPQGQPQGLLGQAMPQQGQQSGQIPPEMAQMIQKMKGAPPEQKQQFIEHIVKTIQESNKPEEQKASVLKQFSEMMQG